MARYEIISADPQIQQAYVSMRRNGQSHNLAEMLALQQPPVDKADRTFLAGLDPTSHTTNLGREQNIKRMARLKKKAERAGVDVNGATYLSGLASYPGDPTAWVRSRDDIRRVAEKKRLRVEGAVDCDYIPTDSAPINPDPGPDPKIIEKETRYHEYKTGVKMRGKERMDFKEKLFNRRKGPNKAKFQG